MKTNSLSTIRPLLHSGRSRKDHVARRSQFRSMFLERLETRTVFASGDLLISEFLANPAGNDTNLEYVELIATRPINFATTPYSVVFTNNGTATAAGWIAGGTLSYGFNINTGSVAAGDVVYVGGSGMAPTGTKLRTINVTNTAGDGFGTLQATAGVLGNGGTSADSIGVFDVAITSIVNSTVPVDAIFFGTATGSAVVTGGSAGFQLPVNDRYSGGKLQTASSIIADPVSGQVAIATGSYDVGTNTFGTNRTWANTATATATSAIALTGLGGTTVSVAATDATKSEGNSGNTSFTFSVARSSSSGTASVAWAVTGSGANPADAADFGGTLPSGTVSFADTEASKVVTVNVSGDTSVESGEGFAFTLSSVGIVGLVLGSPTSATGTIQNDDSSISIAALSANKSEGNSSTTPYTFTVTRAGNTTASATVDYQTTGSGANQSDGPDFSSSSGTATFAIGATTAVVTISVVGDLVAELDETFDVTLSNPVSGSGLISAIVGTPSSATGTILNDDAATQLAIAATDANKSEGNTATTPFTFTVTRTGDTSGASSATWTVTGSGANPASTVTDIAAGTLTGTVSFVATETTQVITVNVNGDLTIEPNEEFTVTLSAPSSGTAISTTSALGLILNDDLSIALPAIATSTSEGNSGTTTVNVTVTRTGDTNVATDVNWAITGTGTNPASANDFGGSVLPSGMITFAIGALTQTISFDIQGDVALEPDETFTLTLTSATGGAVLSTPTQAGTIVNDDFGSLVAGDIVITGINTTNPDQFSFVPLVNLPAGQIIVFTDNAYTGTALNPTEGTVTYTSPVGGVTAGTRIGIQRDTTGNLSTNASVIFGPGTAALTGSNFALSGTGDNLLAYTGTAASPNFLFALNTNTSYITTGSTNANTTYLPSTLAVGTSAVAPLGAATSATIANSEYTGGLTFASAALARASVATVGNWTNSSPIITLNQTAITIVTTVTPAISATPLTKVYDGAVISIVATADDGPGGAAADTSGFTPTYYAGPGLTGGTISVPKNVGSYSVDFAYAGNASYNAVASTAFNFTITTANLPVTGLTGANKVYDSTTVATVSGAATVTPFGSDVVTVGGTPAFTFADKIVAGAKQITALGYTLSGADAANYIIVQPTGLTGNITAASLPVTGLTGANKIYDATPVATATGTPTVSPLLTDVVTVGGTPVFAFADKIVASAKPIVASGYTLSGADAANYSIVQPTGLTGNITPFALTGSITAANKVFDGTTSATILTRTLATVFSGDAVTYIGGTATFDTSAIGSGKTVTATGLSLSGADAGNYTVNTTAMTTANITAPPATIQEAYLFYKGSTFASALGVAGAIDPINDGSGNPEGKDLLRSGASQTTVVTNVSNYSRGINGLVFDVNNLTAATLTASDFVFRRPAGLVSGVVDPVNWTGIVPAPTTINVSVLSGSTSRVRIEFPDWNSTTNTGGIANTWLQVILRANSNTGLTAPVVYYIGHAAGEGAGGSPYRVGSAELSNIQSGINSAFVPLSDVRDVDKSRRVGAGDLSFIQPRVSSTILLQNITIPIAGSASEGAPPPGSGSLLLADEGGGSGSAYAAPPVALESSIASLSTVSFKLTPVNGTTSQVSLSSTSSTSTDAAVSDLYASSVTSIETTNSSAQSIDDFFASFSKKRVRV